MKPTTYVKGENILFPKYSIITHSKVTTKNKIDRDRMDGQKVKSKKEKLIGYSCNLFCDPIGERDQSLSKCMVDLLTFISIEHNPSSHPLIGRFQKTEIHDLYAFGL